MVKCYHIYIYSIHGSYGYLNLTLPVLVHPLVFWSNMSLPGQTGPGVLTLLAKARWPSGKRLKTMENHGNSICGIPKCTKIIQNHAVIWGILPSHLRVWDGNSNKIARGIAVQGVNLLAPDCMDCWAAGRLFSWPNLGTFGGWLRNPAPVNRW